MDYDIDDSDVVMLDDPIDKIEFEPDVNILNLFTNRKSLPKDLFTISLTNLNKHNWFPLVDFKRKMTESETNVKYQIDADAIIQSETDYLVERFDIFKNSQYDYSLVSDALQYSVLCPFVARHGDAYRLPDRDCFREDDTKLERYRLIGKLPPHLYDGDKVVNKGFYICNKPTTQDNYIEFDAQAYMTHLRDAEPGDEFVLVTNDGKRLLTGIESNAAGSHLILKDVAKKKKTIRYDLANFEKNRFMLYSKSKWTHQKCFPKKVFLTENVLVKSTDASPCIITGDDVMGMAGGMSYQKLRDMFPDIDNQVFDIRSWKHLSPPTGSTLETATTTARPRPSKMFENDIDLLVRCGKKPRQMATYEPPPQQPPRQPPFASKSNLVFLSVQESLNHVITKFNPKSVAYLILGKHFRLKNKEFPLNYEVFVLKHLRLPNGRIIWFKEENITALMPVPVVRYEPPVVVQDVDQYISNALDLYYQRKSPEMHVVLPVDYSNYQGQHDFDESLFITEFGWLGNDINNDEDADVDQQMPVDNNYLDKFLNTCVSFARIRLPSGQLNEIRKCLLKEKTNEDLLNNTLVIFGLFIIFAQCNLPRLIIADTTLEQVNSFPIGTSFTLVDHFAQVILKLTKQDYNCRRLKKANSNAWRELLVRVCKALLLSKPALRVHLEAAGNQMNATMPRAKKRVENDTSLWKPIASKRKHVNHLMQMELELTPMTIGEKITTQVKFKPQGKNHSALRSVQRASQRQQQQQQQQQQLIEQEHVTLMAPADDVVSLPDLQTVLGTLVNHNSALKKDPLFSNLYHVTKNETVWNEISTCIVNLQTSCPALGIMNDLSDSVLLDCLSNDFKDFLGKYAYNYVGAQDFIHMDQIKRLHLDRDRVKWILDHLLNFASFVIYPPDGDLHYALVYIVYKVMWAIESEEVEGAMEFGPTLCHTNEYLIKLLQQKQAIHSINVKTARDKYEIIRENRKKTIMKMYGEKDAEGRQGLQKVVRMGLVNIEDVVSDYLANIADDADAGANGD